MEPSTVAAFALASFLVELTPGPNMTWLAIVAAADGRSRGLAAVAGVGLGLAIVGLASALGLGAIVAASPVLFEALRWGGAAFLFWLAWDAWRETFAEPDTPIERDGLARYFRRGLIVNVLNPKAAVFYIAILPAFIDPERPLGAQVALLTAVYVVVATLVHAVIVLLAGTIRPVLESHAASLLIRRILAVALALVALWFLVKTTA